MQALLSGMRVVEGSAFIAAPSGGMTLAQLGADVIRFDQIGGGIDYRRWPVTNEGKSLYWHSLNKGKRSFAVDFRSPEGKELVTQLIAADGDDAGIFLTNFPAKGWLTDSELRKRREDLIYLNLTGDRHGGSALDYTVNSKVGLPFLTGDGAKPNNNPFPAWDVIAGQHIALGLLTAERHRRIHGEGQCIRLALADVALATMGHLGFLAEAEVNGEGRQAVGNHVFGSFGHDFECSDGERVMIVGVSPIQWNAIVAVTDTEQPVAALEESLGLKFNREGDRFEARDELLKLFQPWFGQRDSATVQQALDAAGVCWGPYQTIQQLVDTDRDCSVDNPLFERVEQPGIGEYLMPSNPLNFEGLGNVPVTPAPLLGQHTDEILGDTLGLSSIEIAKLHDSGIVAGPNT
ncbi:MAG: 2-methylfumaryl-CoA isomerase [Pseudohongiella sp.]|nr:MAG: 2-methylfumaryl-CoA isomerase [Pseudohongiella sp.]